MFRKTPEISVCIPVYNTEQLLESCIMSVLKQEVPQGIKPGNFIEILVLSDGSISKTESGEEIVRRLKKFTKFKIRFYEHTENRGLLEARRSMVYLAKGKYIFNLDSDDTLPPQSLKFLYNNAISSCADIVHGMAEVVASEDASEKLKEAYYKKVNNVFIGELSGFQIFDGFLLQGNHMPFLWGKLINRQVYIKAFEHIPYIECTLNEELVQYFWLSYEAKKYFGIQEKVYNYSISTGITSHIKITDLSRWKKICSAAGAFTAIYTELENLESGGQKILSSKQDEALSFRCIMSLKNSLVQLENCVSEELKPEALELLKEFWGEKMVQRTIDQEIQ